MSVIGIVGEYNPFHLGHLYHIEKTKELLGADSPVVCVMSGDFIQRGEAAVYSKFARAEAACKSGVNLVLELPAPWALSSAEGFARGAVGVLNDIGVVTHLSFGSECGETEPIEKLAEILLNPMLIEEIKSYMAKEDTVSFAAARQQVLAKKVGSLAQVLETPNNILAVEYVKAIYDSSSSMKPVTVQRFGSGHNTSAESGPKSASELRTGLARGMDISDNVPAAAMDVFLKENKLGRGPVMMEALESAIISRLRMLTDEAYLGLPDAGEGVAVRLMNAAREETGIDAILSAAKSKRYALSRIRRMLMCAALGIDAKMAVGRAPYARVLAADEKGCELLRSMNTASRIPILTKPASVKNMDAECEKIFGIGSRAHDLYVLGYTAKEEKRGGADWRTGPKIIIKNQ